MRAIRRYFSYMGRYLPLYWTILTATLIVESALEILYSYITKKTLNAIELIDPTMFRHALFLCVIVVVCKCLFPYLRYFEIRLVRKLVFELKLKLFHKLMRLDMPYFESNHSGEALKTLNWDANSLKDSYFSHVYWVLGKITLGISSLIAMLVYSPILTAISVAICLVTVVVSIWLNGQMKKNAGQVQENTAKLAKYLSNILAGFPILKMYAGADIVLDYYKKENHKVTAQENKRVQKSAVLELLTFLLGILGSFGTIIAGAYLVAQKRMDYGTVMAVVTLQMSFSNNMQRLGSSIAIFTTSLIKAERVFDFLELECEEAESQKEEVTLDMCAEPIAITDLHFSYADKAPVFEGFDMNVAFGENVMIMGESGCGKSTLLKLLLNFYQVPSGQIRIYGKDINQYPLWQLRNLITYIPQENYLFEGTIAENIAYGAVGLCNLDETKRCLTSRDILLVKSVAKSAYADAFIEEMKDGYDTHVTDGGRNLSGGQRQRIAIARAFLKNSPILLMDEPLSALDSQSEQMIQNALKELMKGKVVLMVTHRRSGVGDFDRVVVL